MRPPTSRGFAKGRTALRATTPVASLGAPAATDGKPLSPTPAAKIHPTRFLILMENKQAPAFMIADYCAASSRTSGNRFATLRVAFAGPTSALRLSPIRLSTLIPQLPTFPSSLHEPLT